MQWRLTLDPPYSFAIENGWQRDVHCKDFSPRDDTSANGVWRDPVTGTMMLRPQVLDRNWYQDLVGLASFTHQANYWRSVHRSTDNANLFATVKPAGSDFTLIELLIDIAIVAILFDVSLKDNLVWALQSEFNLAVDEGFAIHYHSITDHMIRKHNWFMVQWDYLGLHFSQEGIVRAYKYDASDMTAAPTLIEQFELASPGDLLARDGYFWFIPIPTVGLLIMHSYVQQGINNLTSNVQNAGTRAHLLKLDSTQMSDGTFQLMNSSPVRIALNPYQDYTVGFQRLRYPTSGTYTDAVFDPEYQPANNPSTYAPILIPNGKGTVTATVMNADNTGAWAAGTDQQGRMQLALSTSDSKYTPFVAGYSVAWAPVLETRSTSPLEINSTTAAGSLKQDKITRLEWTDDIHGRWEGSADLILESAAAIHIMQRGDSTFKLEFSPDSGATWTVLAAGFAKDWDPEAVKLPNTNLYYTCVVKLIDFSERFREVHEAFQHAYDNITPGDAINKVLQGAGFPPISPLPAGSTAFKIPVSANVQGWKLTPREGDSALDILRMLMTYLKTQGVEWRMVFDYYSTWNWVLQQRPHSSGSWWTLSPYSDDLNVAQQVWPYSAYKPKPEPPEGNVVVAEGVMEAPGAQNLEQQRVLSDPIENLDSLNDTTSLQYLGRRKFAKATFYPVAEQEQINIMARRFYAAAAFRRVSGTVEMEDWQPQIGPDTQVIVVDDTRSQIDIFWVKRRTVIAEDVNGLHAGEMRETASIEVDTVWEDVDV